MAISPATIPNVLSIAGSDPSGGAGIQADLKTFAALRCHGLSALTALTAQNTQGVKEMFALPPEFVAAEIDALFEDSAIAAVKIGMLGSRQNVEIVAERLAHYRARAIVLDPVFASSSGQALATEDIAESFVTHLAPLATLITPNLMEAAKLAQVPVPTNLAEMQAVAETTPRTRLCRRSRQGRPSRGRDMRRYSLRWSRIPHVQRAARRNAQHAWDGLHIIVRDCGPSCPWSRPRRGDRSGEGLSAARA